MAKKTASKKTAKKKAGAKKKTAKASSRTAKKSAAKKTAKATTKKKSTAKKSGKKVASKKTAKATTKKKASAQKAAGKKASGKASSKKTASKKPAAKKPASPKKPTKNTEAKTPSKAKTAGKADTAKKSGSDAKSKDADSSKPQRKGITIVSKKTSRKSGGKKTIQRPIIPGGSILGPGRKPPKPLIPSGPSASAQAEEEIKKSRRKKSPLTKKQIETFTEILRAKRAALLGDVTNMEGEALKSGSGSLSNMSQHFADQGSDAYDQSLSLDLAAADRKLIREIDAALERVSEGTYGLCVVTGQPIPLERLEELPWTSYSIEGARLAERNASA